MANLTHFGTKSGNRGTISDIFCVNNKCGITSVGFSTLITAVVISSDIELITVSEPSASTGCIQSGRIEGQIIQI